MRIKNLLLFLCCWGLICSPCILAQSEPDELGQTFQINVRLHSFVGKPSWLLMIRDLDHEQNIPYLYDFKRGQSFWLAFTYGRNYLITASSLQFSPYKKLKINDFCHLETHGRIIHGESLYITITGDLTANTNTYTCTVQRYADADFNVATPEQP